MIELFDVVVVGAGIAGASVAADLAATHRVLLLERESQPGYHSTGRSAALFSELYGNAAIRALSRASREFFFEPPAGFTETPLVSERGALYVARPDQLESLGRWISSPDIQAGTTPVSGAEARRLSPLLRDGYAAEGLFEPGAHDVDVNALHRGYLREVSRRGGRTISNSPLQGLRRSEGGWRVETASEVFEASIVVNAAGAWADDIAMLAAAPPIGLQPRRRTVVVVDAPQDAGVLAAPFTIDVDEQFYFKADAGRLLLSPADETPSPACDVQPDEMDVAIAVDRIENATTLRIARIHNKWAGLRSFVDDRSPVVGFDPACPGFFWLAGQGGYGIQTAPAMGRLAAALVRGEPMPAHIAASGLNLAELAPERLVRQRSGPA